MGMESWQGPHQVAQKSKSTGWPKNELRLTVLPERSLSSKLGAGRGVEARDWQPVRVKTISQPKANVRTRGTLDYASRESRRFLISGLGWTPTSWSMTLPPLKKSKL